MSRTHHGKGRQRRQGVHKHRDSPETILWEAEHLIPRQPAWMDATTYTALARLRADLDTGRT